MAIVDSYSVSSYLADQVLADLPPCQMMIVDSYCESSYLADQVLADLNPLLQMAIIVSYSESLL